MRLRFLASCSAVVNRCAETRLRTGHLALQTVLASELEAAGHHVRRDGRRLTQRHEMMGDDGVGLDERPKGAVGHQQPRVDEPRLHLREVGHLPRAPVRVEVDHLGIHPFAELRLLREEELEFQQVAQAERLFPALFIFAAGGVAADIENRELDDRPAHEPVDDRVAVERAEQLLPRLEAVDRLDAFGIAVDEVVRHQKVQSAVQALLRAERAGRVVARDAALLGVGEDGLDHLRDLGEGESPVLYPQQREEQQRRSGDHRGPVDPVGDLESDLAARQPALGARGRSLCRSKRPERLAKVQRFAEPDVHGTEVAALLPCIFHQPAEPFGGLDGAARLRGHVRGLREQVIDDGGGDGIDVVALQRVDRVDQPVDEPQPGGHELARAGPRALDIPLHIEALADEEAQIALQDKLIDLVVAEAAPDEDDPHAAAERADRPEGHVDAAERVVLRQAVVIEQRRHDIGVQVRAVGGQEHQRVVGA